MKFADLRLIEPLLRAVSAAGYTTATPVQAQAIPLALAGRDVLGSAQTGTGKTAAFALPILQRLSAAPTAPAAGTTTIVPAHKVASRRSARALVLAPTRELATQISDDFHAYGKFLKLHQAIIFGGVNQRPQVDSLRRGVDIIIATPGRLLDLMEQGHVDLRSVEVLVLDEADRMLDMGFIHDIKKITAKLPRERQTMFFSATMPREIRGLADSLLKNPATVEVTPVTNTADNIEQSVYFVDRGNKPTLLAHLVNNLPMPRAIVFTRTKHGADRVVRHLHIRGIRAEAIHGNKSQNARQRALDNFKANKIPVLVATDIASRGIDVDGITHVVNYDITHEPETYIHRIGRTARAGASGAAVSLCDPEERSNLRAIEKLIKQTIVVKSDHPTYTQPNSKQAQQHEQRPEQNGGGAHRKPFPHAPKHRSEGPTHRSQPARPHSSQPARSGASHPAKSGPPQPTSHAPRARHPLHPVGGGVRHSNFNRRPARSR